MAQNKKDIIDTIIEKYQTKNEIDNVNQQFKHKLISDKEEIKKLFGNLILYSEKLLYQLWESPKSLATILLNADTKDIKGNLSNFIIHNLYSDVKNNEQLIYIIALILKKEINNINDNETCCGIILKELYKKKEVKYFFKTIFLDIFKKLETLYSNQNLIFNIEQLIEEINQEHDNINIIDLNQIQLIKDKYIFNEINSELLNKILKKDTSEEMKLLINKLKKELSNYSDIYSNADFKEKINLDEKNKDEIINYYISSFIQLTDIIDIFFVNLIKNFDLMPYYIKCIFKIISISTKKNNKNETCLEKMNYLNIFFFDVLLIPILNEPSNNTFTNEFLITEKTKNKIHFFKEVLNKIFFGELFRKSDFIPFNYYIIEKFSCVIQFQKLLNNIKLPNFIEKILNNDEFAEKYEYNYFKENPKDNIIYRNISFKINELCSLISNSEKCEKDININKKILKKFKINEYQKKLEELESNEEIDINGQETSMINFSEPTTVKTIFLFTDFIINKSEKMEKIKYYENYSNNYFNIKEIKEVDEISKNKNNIIKIKNLLCGLLFNSEPLIKSNFSQTNLSDITSILKTLQNYSIINSNISLDYNYIPLNWYINYLFQNMKKIKTKLDFNKIINELEKDISTSIKNILFEDLDIFIECHEKIKNEKRYNEKIKYILEDINLNGKVENIIRVENFVIDFNISYEDLKDDEKKSYEFMQELINKKDKYFKLFIKKEYNIYYNTIQHFINNFPNISIFQNSEIDNFQLIKDEKIHEIFESYFFFLKKNLLSKDIVNESNINDIFNKIYDYIFESLHPKLFPQEQIIEDIKIFQNCFKHQWIEPKHLFKEEKNYVLENFLLESINYLQKFEGEKSPRKKMENLKKIFDFLYKLGNFSNDEVQLVDDELALLTIVVVKAQPLKLYSNCKFCELFYVKGGFMANILTKLILLCEKLKNELSEKDFYNVSAEEYNVNCKNIINKIFE